MTETLTAKRIITHPFFAFFCFLSVCFLLPKFGGSIPTMVANASILSVSIAVMPEQFRSRNGSLVAATILVAAMWLGAALITVMTMMGAIRN